MTTFFKKLFGTSPAPAQTEIPTISGIPAFPTRELFIEDRDPREFLAPEPPKKTRRERTILEELLSIDYAGTGHKDGYEIHDLAGLDMQLELIASDFRQAFDKALQDIEAELEPLGIHLTERVQQGAPELYEKIHTRQDQLVKQKRDLILQKDLAVTGEGFIEKPHRYYMAGFRRGYDLYVEEQLIFKHIKTL
jgi:hypothetical protein